jgi:outer membrane protein OmpA-like peptidoglycan-associated protein
MKKHVTIYSVLASVMLFSGCTGTVQHVPGAYSLPNSNKTAGASVGAVGGYSLAEFYKTTLFAPTATVGIIGGAIGSYYDTVGFAAEIAKIGGQVIVYGNQVRIVLPADYLFDPAENEIKESSYRTMERLTKVLLTFGHQPMQISGYSDEVVITDDHNDDFSYRRAQSVATFLWTHGIPQELMTVQGLGVKPNVATNHILKGSRANRRIEITMHRDNMTGSYY